MFRKERMEKIYQFLWIITNVGIWGKNLRSRHLTSENSTSILSSGRKFFMVSRTPEHQKSGPMFDIMLFLCHMFK